MNDDIIRYHDKLPPERRAICELLFSLINENLAYTKSKLWHGHPVWFIDGNPIVGYSSEKSGVKLLFWSGASFGEPGLKLGSGKFKDAHITYIDTSKVNADDIKKWLGLSERIQWDYKNIVKRKGRLERLQ